MHYIYFDSGTSNTRGYLIRDNKIIDFAKKGIGAKDVSISGDNFILLKALKELYDRLLKNNQLKGENIDGIYASGMVTTPFGVKEVPHLTVPLSLSRLYNEVYVHFEPLLFKKNIHLIRGVKTIPEGFEVNRFNVATVNNMRGEELEVFGILSCLDEEWSNERIAIFLPGSHTQIVYVRKKVIEDILSTFYGELFHAVATSTLLSTSITSQIDNWDEEMVLLGFQHLKEYGINRALYLVNTMKIFSSMNNKEKTSFLEGIITGGVIQAFQRTREQKWTDINKVIVMGNSNIISLHEILLKQLPQIEVKLVQAADKESFAARGFLELLKKGFA